MIHVLFCLKGEPSPLPAIYDQIYPAPLEILLALLISPCAILAAQGPIQPYNVGRARPCLSHLAFADDLLIFINGSLRNLTRFREFLQLYQDATGQAVNYQKSQFVTPLYLHTAHIRRMENAIQMHAVSLLIKYLGISLFKGKARTSHYLQLISTFRQS